MAELIGAAGNFSGTIAYTNESKGVFHSQGEEMNTINNVWSIDDVEANLHLGNVAIDPVWQQIINDMMIELPEIESFDWDSTEGDGREIRDAVFHIWFNYAFSDQSIWTISVRYDGQGIQVIKPDVPYPG